MCPQLWGTTYSNTTKSRLLAIERRRHAESSPAAKPSTLTNTVKHKRLSTAAGVSLFGHGKLLSTTCFYSCWQSVSGDMHLHTSLDLQFYIPLRTVNARLWLQFNKWGNYRFWILLLTLFAIIFEQSMCWLIRIDGWRLNPRQTFHLHQWSNFQALNGMQEQLNDARDPMMQDCLLSK